MADPKKTPARTVSNAEIRQWMPLAKKVARARARRVPDSIPIEDLEGAALEGLFGALRDYDPSKGDFERYATVCIGSAISGYLRSTDILKRTQRKAVREGKQDAPIVVRANKDEPERDPLENLPGAPDEQPDVQFHGLAEHAVVRAAIKRLAPKWRSLLEGRAAGQTLAQVASDLGVTETRVWQLRKEALEKLRAILRRVGYTQTDEERKAKRLEWARANRAKKKILDAAWKAKNPDKQKEYSQRYRSRHPLKDRGAPKPCTFCGELFRPWRGGAGLFCSHACWARSRARFRPHVCEQCGVIFRADSCYYRKQKRERKFCSRACSDKAQNQKITATCVQCGAEFRMKPHEVAYGRKHCSIACVGKARTAAGRIDKTCERCGVSFRMKACYAKRKSANGRFCSRACYHAVRRERIQKS